MKEAFVLIKENNLIKSGDKIAVAVSGGVDSMALLHFLHGLTKEIDFFLSVITVDHSIRENSHLDNQLVLDYCKQNDIKANCFTVDVLKYSKENKKSVELSAREMRYGIFDSLLNKKIVDKIALAHHLNDQAETVLMNLFRGAGSQGMGGMKVERNGYIRPFLNTSKKTLEKYAKMHNLPVAQDHTNQENDYARNYLRNEILPLIENQWKGASENIASFAEIYRQDTQHFNESIKLDGILFIDKMAKVPLRFFYQPIPYTSRLIFAVLKQIGVVKDIERKHIKIIQDFVIKADSGKKINLPDKLVISKEYDFIIFQNKHEEIKTLQLAFRLGRFKAGEYGSFEVKKVQSMSEEGLFVDFDKVPKGARWRYMETKDTITKFGGGTKRLKEFLVDKKISARERKILPVLAFENTIYAVVGVEISALAKVDENTSTIYQIIAYQKS